MTHFPDTKFQRWLDRNGACWAGRKRVGALPFWQWWDEESEHPEYMYWCWLRASKWYDHHARRYRLQDAIRRELGVGFYLGMYGLMRDGNLRAPTPAERKRACDIMRRVCPRRGVKP